MSSDCEMNPGGTSGETNGSVHEHPVWNCRRAECSGTLTLIGQIIESIGDVERAKERAEKLRKKFPQTFFHGSVLSCSVCGDRPRKKNGRSSCWQRLCKICEAPYAVNGFWASHGGHNLKGSEIKIEERCSHHKLRMRNSRLSMQAIINLDEALRREKKWYALIQKGLIKRNDPISDDTLAAHDGEWYEHLDLPADQLSTLKERITVENQKRSARIGRWHRQLQEQRCSTRNRNRIKRSFMNARVLVANGPMSVLPGVAMASNLGNATTFSNTIPHEHTRNVKRFRHAVTTNSGPFAASVSNVSRETVVSALLMCGQESVATAVRSDTHGVKRCAVDRETPPTAHAKRKAFVPTIAQHISAPSAEFVPTAARVEGSRAGDLTGNYDEGASYVAAGVGTPHTEMGASGKGA